VIAWGKGSEAPYKSTFLITFYARGLHRRTLKRPIPEFSTYVATATARAKDRLKKPQRMLTPDFLIFATTMLTVIHVAVLTVNVITNAKNVITVEEVEII